MRGGSRDAVMDALRAASPQPSPPPVRAARPTAPTDLVAALRANLESAGGRLALAGGRSGADVATAVGGLKAAAHLWSAWPGLDSRGIGAAPARVNDLAQLEFTVLAGVLAVAESGAVWNVPADPMERAAALLAEHIVLVVERDNVVANLHDAYARIAPDASPFGWLLCGPSKTADIEQSLVLGAHGPRQMTLVLIGD